MSASPILVLDTNILIRAVLGKKVRELLISYNDSVGFFTPDVCMEDAEKYLPIVFEKRGLLPEPPLAVLFDLKPLLQIVDKNIYQAHAA